MRYRITVRGQLAAAVEEQIGDVVAEVAAESATYVVEIVDQADLFGVLGAIQRSGVELLSIESSDE
ncbi:MAG: hypothetical protein AAF548_20295 [Actinomycetota bacterium]